MIFFRKTRGRKDRDTSCDEAKLYLQVTHFFQNPVVFSSLDLDPVH